MTEQVFVETCAWYAYINAQDPDHGRTKKFFHAFSRQLITSSYVCDETVTQVLSRLGYEKAIRVGKTLRDPSVVMMVWVTPRDEQAAWDLFQKRLDKTYSFTDCTSFIAMRRMKISRCLATDEHFQQEGREVVI